MFSYFALLLRIDLVELIRESSPVSKIILVVLLVFSVLSWAVIFAKWSMFRKAGAANLQFLRAFRKATALETVAMASEQFRDAPLVGVFEFGYDEMKRQLKARGNVTNKVSLERTLQLGISEELTRLERHMSLLATVASVSPFIGLFGTVLGVIDAFTGLGSAGSASLRAVAPGIAEALIATAMGLAAAIPAAVFYNYFGHSIREMGARMDDFTLEFMNMMERVLGE